MHANHVHSTAYNVAAEHLAGWQRSLAELKNNERQNRKNFEKISLIQQRDMLQPLLDLADNFAAVVRHVPAELKKNTWATGVLHVSRQLTETLSTYGVVTMDVKGQEFDPQKHEAVGQVSSQKVSPGHVVELVANGYMLGDAVLRPAKVKIAKQ